MSEDFTSVSVRITNEMLKFIEDNSGRGKRFKDRSAGFRYLVTFGMKAEALMNMKKDPEKWKDFENKIQEMMLKDSVPHVLEKMNDDELDNMAFYIANLKNQKATQLILKSS